MPFVSTGSAIPSCPAPIGATGEVLLGHWSGGKLTAQLIERRILPAFQNAALAALDDQAIVPFLGPRLAFTTDSYVVTPIFFPGGDIGELAVNGTVNDLAMGGAAPLYLSLAFILEEGFPLADLDRVIASIRRSAERAGVAIVTGDTKVVDQGKGDKIFINTAGVGIPMQGTRLGSSEVKPGDAILLSGTIGDHGVAILSVREGLELEGDVRSDTAPLHGLTKAMLAASRDIHAMRDPTRGGLAATLVEIASRRRLGIEVDEASIPMRDGVKGACEILGLDPLLLANEGKLVAFVPEESAGRVLEAMRRDPLGRDAARIGRVTAERPGTVVLSTRLGRERIVDLPAGAQLPRIC